MSIFQVGVLGALKLAMLHSRSKLSVVHIHNMPDILVLAGVIPRLAGSILILDVHDPMPELFMAQHHCPSREFTGQASAGFQEKIRGCVLADRVIWVKQMVRENLRIKGVGAEKIFIVHNFPDLKLFPVQEPASSWPREQGQTGGPVLRNCYRTL